MTNYHSKNICVISNKWNLSKYTFVKKLNLNLKLCRIWIYCILADSKFKYGKTTGENLSGNKTKQICK